MVLFGPDFEVENGRQVTKISLYNSYSAINVRNVIPDSIRLSGGYSATLSSWNKDNTILYILYKDLAKICSLDFFHSI
jgi:hypothetical protein